ncbi:hypothetical protein CBR_g29760 [Chara braunii]|uniref:Uncharacterized protein n=1 Tax=Chara braunii TaxID=69332 RepID=A0A388LBC5_CHABU|nr:hypothetical protein CBR_g29760 [Chara braunii]|eukprot:GBG79611.1 hypothetical protein CBR_g29760 [Chara braunii]
MMVVLSRGERRGVGFGREGEKEGVVLRTVKEDASGLVRQRGCLLENEQAGNRDVMLEERDIRNKVGGHVKRSIDADGAVIECAMLMAEEACPGGMIEDGHEEPSCSGQQAQESREDAGGVGSRDAVDAVAEIRAVENRPVGNAGVRVALSGDTMDAPGMGKALPSQQEGAHGTSLPACVSVEESGELKAQLHTGDLKDYMKERHDLDKKEEDDDASPYSQLPADLSMEAVEINGEGNTVPEQSVAEVPSSGIHDGNFFSGCNLGPENPGSDSAVAAAVGSCYSTWGKRVETGKMRANVLAGPIQEGTDGVPKNSQSGIEGRAVLECRGRGLGGADHSVPGLTMEDLNSRASSKDVGPKELLCTFLKHGCLEKDSCVAIESVEAGGMDNGEKGRGDRPFGDGDGSKTVNVVGESNKGHTCSALANGAVADGSELNTAGSVGSDVKGAGMAKSDNMTDEVKQRKNGCTDRKDENDEEAGKQVNFGLLRPVLPALGELRDGKYSSAEEVERECNATCSVVHGFKGAMPHVQTLTGRETGEAGRGEENSVSDMDVTNGREGGGVNLGNELSEKAHGGTVERSEISGMVDVTVVAIEEEGIQESERRVKSTGHEECSSALLSEVGPQVCVPGANEKAGQDCSEEPGPGVKFSFATTTGMEVAEPKGAVCMVERASGSRQQQAIVCKVDVDLVHAVDVPKNQNGKGGLSDDNPKGGTRNGATESSRVQPSSTMGSETPGQRLGGDDLQPDSVLAPPGTFLAVPEQPLIAAETLAGNAGVLSTNPVLLLHLPLADLPRREGECVSGTTTENGGVEKITQAVENVATGSAGTATSDGGGREQQGPALIQTVAVDEDGLSVQTVDCGILRPDCEAVLPGASGEGVGPSPSSTDADSLGGKVTAIVDLVPADGAPGSASAVLLQPCIGTQQTETSLGHGNGLARRGSCPEEGNQDAEGMKGQEISVEKCSDGMVSTCDGGRLKEEALTCLPQGPVLVSECGVVHPLPRCESLGVMSDLNQDLTSLLRPEAELPQNDSILIYFDQSNPGPDTDVLSLPNVGTGSDNPCAPSAMHVDSNTSAGGSSWHAGSVHSAQATAPGIPTSSGRTIPPVSMASSHEVPERGDRVSAGRRLLAGGKHGPDGSNPPVSALTQLVPKLVPGRQSSLILRSNVYNIAAASKAAFSGMIPTPGFNPSLSGDGASEEILPEPKPHLTLHVVPHLSSNLAQGAQSPSQTVRATGHPLSPFPNASAITETRGAPSSALKPAAETPPRDARNRITGKAVARRSVLSLKARAAVEPPNSTHRPLPQSLPSKRKHQGDSGYREGSGIASSSGAIRSQSAAATELHPSKGPATARVGGTHVAPKSPSASNARGATNHSEGRQRDSLVSLHARRCDASAADGEEQAASLSNGLQRDSIAQLDAHRCDGSGADGKGQELDQEEAAREAKAKELAEVAAKARQRARQATKIASEKASLAVAATARAATAVKRAAELLCQSVPAGSPVHLRTRMNSILGTAERLARRRKAGDGRTDDQSAMGVASAGECSGSVVTVAAAADACGGDVKRRSPPDTKFRPDREFKVVRVGASSSPSRVASGSHSPAATDHLTESATQDGSTLRKLDVSQHVAGNIASAQKTSTSSEQLSFAVERKWSSTARRGRKPVRARGSNNHDLVLHSSDRQMNDRLPGGVGMVAAISGKERVGEPPRGGGRDLRRARLRGKARGWSHRKKCSGIGRVKKKQVGKPKIDKTGFPQAAEKETDKVLPGQFPLAGDPGSVDQTKRARATSCKVRTSGTRGGGSDRGNRGAEPIERLSKDEWAGGERTGPKRLAMMAKTAALKACVVDKKVRQVEASACKMRIEGVDGAEGVSSGLMKKCSEQNGNGGSEEAKAIVGSMACVRREARSKRRSRARRVTNDQVAGDVTRGSTGTAELLYDSADAGRTVKEERVRGDKDCRPAYSAVELAYEARRSDGEGPNIANVTVVDDGACGQAPPLKVYFRRKAVKMEVRFEDGYEQMESDTIRERSSCEALTWVRSVRNSSRSTAEGEDGMPPAKTGGTHRAPCAGRANRGAVGQGPEEENGKPPDTHGGPLESGEGWHEKQTKVRKRLKADGVSQAPTSAKEGPILPGGSHPEQEGLPLGKEDVQREVCRSKCFGAGNLEVELSSLGREDEERSRPKARFKQDVGNLTKRQEAGARMEDLSADGKGDRQLVMGAAGMLECGDGFLDLAVDLTCREEVEGVNSEGVVGSSSLEVPREGMRYWNRDADGITGTSGVDLNGFLREVDAEQQEQLERDVEGEAGGPEELLRRKRAQRWNSLKELLQQKFHSRPRKKHKLDGFVPSQEQCVGIGAMKPLPQFGHARKR